MKIVAVEPNSIAAQQGFNVGDQITHINGQPIRDEIDYRFHASDELLKIKISRNGTTAEVVLEKDPDETLGLTFEPFKYRCCGNKCIFCFIDQNPPGLRSSLYFKDEDFRLSFLYGNYVTLTNITQKDLKRIIAQRLSPLYISVHAVDPQVRQKMLGIHHDDQLLQKIKRLTQNRIELHVQIVLCPGYNDGPVLAHSIRELSQFYPYLNSIAIVPVGLTRHRAQLPSIQAVTPKMAVELLEWGTPLANEFYQKWHHHLIYFADEFYLLAQQPIPPAERYDDFSQFENGVGMTRHLIDEFQKAATEFPDKLPAPQSITLVTGTLAEPIIQSVVVRRLAQIEHLTVNLIAVPNHFYGESVTVSGLLTGQDIYQTLKKHLLGDKIFLPNNCVNYDQLFLDNWTVGRLEQLLRKQIFVIDNDFREIFNESNL